MSAPSPLATPMPWDLVAPAYADELMPRFEAFSRAALALAAPPPASRVVDVACGPGTLAILAAQSGHPVDALDFSPAMVDALSTRARTLGLSTIDPRVGDGQELPYADATFAAGFSMFGLMFFPDRARGFAELRRVLAPGARAVVSSWPTPDQVPEVMTLFRAVPEAMERVTGAAPPAPAGPPPLSTRDACIAEMSASFADVEVHRHEIIERADSAAELFDRFARTTAPLVMLRKKLGEDTWSKIADVARASVERAFGAGAPAVRMPAWLTVGMAR